MEGPDLPEVIPVPPGTIVAARLPTPGEVDRWELDPQQPTPVLVACGRVWPADRYELCMTGWGSQPAEGQAG